MTKRDARRGKSAKAAEVTRQSSKPRNAGLSDEIIVKAALAVAERVGVDRLTMRDLAAELGVTQMATYYHFKNKRELLRAVIDATFQDLPDAHQVDGSWSERLAAATDSSLKALSQWKGMSNAFAMAGTDVPNAIRLSRSMTDTLQEAGFDRDEALMGTSLLATWGLGYIVLNDAGAPEAPRPLSPGAARDGGPAAEDYEQFAIEVILAGLEARLKQKPARRSKAATARSGGTPNRTKAPASSARSRR